MEMKLLTSEQLEAVYRQTLSVSFPREELKPLRAMQELRESGDYHAWGLFDGDEIAGVATTWAYAQGWRLFDYLCVAPARRNDGLGSRLIEGLVETERGNVLFGESEAPDYAPDPALAARRIGFYKRNGAKDAGYDMTLFGVAYRVLYWAEREIPAEELMAQHRAVYRKRFAPGFYERVIQIPWTAADGVPQPLDWDKLEREYRENTGL